MRKRVKVVSRRSDGTIALLSRCPYPICSRMIAWISSRVRLLCCGCHAKLDLRGCFDVEGRKRGLIDFVWGIVFMDSLDGFSIEPSRHD